MRTKDEYLLGITDRKRAFQNIARELGEQHQIVKMMGSLAWGRSNADRGLDQNTIRHVVHEYAYLEGYFECLNLYSRDHDQAAQRVMLRHWSNTT